MMTTSEPLSAVGKGRQARRTTTWKTFSDSWKLSVYSGIARFNQEQAGRRSQFGADARQAFPRVMPSWR
jgi:hypothetical protein